ncbi:hypothetical protein WA026_009291 [Henosepilachna vigintioctopunctata]|uniref:Secreted protein n=1 Tax=Henosepilachna vigintioctopunctata TaxID=420089 RepID=A0AAW1UQG0_9CUCU
MATWKYFSQQHFGVRFVLWALLLKPDNCVLTVCTYTSMKIRCHILSKIIYPPRYGLACRNSSRLSTGNSRQKYHVL